MKRIWKDVASSGSHVYFHFKSQSLVDSFEDIDIFIMNNSQWREKIPCWLFILNYFVFPWPSVHSKLRPSPCCKIIFNFQIWWTLNLSPPGTESYRALCLTWGRSGGRWGRGWGRSGWGRALWRTQGRGSSPACPAPASPPTPWRAGAGWASHSHSRHSPAMKVRGLRRVLIFLVFAFTKIQRINFSQYRKFLSFQIFHLELCYGSEMLLKLPFNPIGKEYWPW